MLHRPTDVPDLITAWQTHGDQRARTRLLRLHDSQLRRAAREASRRWGHDVDDCLQMASLGFLHALDKFDDSFGISLAGYAAGWIRAYIFKLHAGQHAVSVPSSRLNDQIYIRRATRDLVAEGIAEPTPEMVASRIPGFSAARVTRTLEGIAVSSLDAPIGEDGSYTKMDRLPAPEAERPDQLLEAALTQRGAAAAIQEAMATLSPREQQVIQMTLVDELMQTEIADALGLTRQAISLAMKRAVDKLREVLAGDERAAEMLG